MTIHKPPFMLAILFEEFDGQRSVLDIIKEPGLPDRNTKRRLRRKVAQSFHHASAVDQILYETYVEDGTQSTEDVTHRYKALIDDQIR